MEELSTPQFPRRSPPCCRRASRRTSRRLPGPVELVAVRLFVERPLRRARPASGRSQRRRPGPTYDEVVKILHNTHSESGKVYRWARHLRRVRRRHELGERRPFRPITRTGSTGAQC